MYRQALNTLSLIAALASTSWAALGQEVAPPASTPAEVEWNAVEGTLRLRYHGTVVLDATLRAQGADEREAQRVAVELQSAEAPGDKVEQRLKFVPARPQEGLELVLRGVVLGSEDAFPAETHSEAQRRFPYVRNSVGLSRNLRNNAVYDRRWDWVLMGPPNGHTRIKPTGKTKGQLAFSWESRGSSPEIVFRPLFYQKHKGLRHYKPWTYKVWEGSLTGYCTWWAYKTGFSQETLDALLAVFVEKHLPDFGYNYMQFDNCYQMGNGSSPEGWLTWNGRFPGGPEYAIRRIRRAGMKPGIWVHRVHRPNDPNVADIVKKHPDWFVRKGDGSLLYERGFYSLNTHNKDAVDRMARPTFRGLAKQGWAYVKIDGAGDLLNNYRKAPEFFEKIESTPGQTLRRWDEVAREELGPDVYILSCWGVQPGIHVIGLADGCRLWRDGFGTAEFERYNSWNGVVWRNDPDHCDIMPKHGTDTVMSVFAVKEAPVESINRPALCSMAGGVLMVSDLIEVYKEDRNLEGMKRSAPVLFTVPGQLYDVNPRSPGQYGIGHYGNESPWWLLEIDREFDRWSVLARFQWGKKADGWKLPGAPEQEVRFADLGLADDREYLVFEFWRQAFLGKAKGSFAAPAQGMDNGLQIFAIREARAHPWIISTTRHISQGGVDLLDVKWDGSGNVLSGRSAVVIGDPYVMTIYLPDGYRLQTAEVSGEKVVAKALPHSATVRITPAASRTVDWRISFTRYSN